MSFIYSYRKNLRPKSEAKDGGNSLPVPDPFDFCKEYAKISCFHLHLKNNAMVL